MTTEDFIKDAIAGGWRFDKSVTENDDTVWLLSGDDFSTKALMLLDPKSWQAVGKVRGWDRIFSMASYGTTGETIADVGSVGCYEFDGVQEDDNSLPENPTPEWQYRMHRFIDLLIEGKDYESALSEIS